MSALLVQCYRCQRLGYTASGSRSGICCMVCGETILKRLVSHRYRSVQIVKVNTKQTLSSVHSLKMQQLQRDKEHINWLIIVFHKVKHFYCLEYMLEVAISPHCLLTYPGRGIQMSSYSAIV